MNSLQNIDQAQLCRTASHAFTDAMRLEEAYEATQILSRLRLGTDLQALIHRTVRAKLEHHLQVP